MEDMYREMLLDYYRNPPNKGELSSSDMSCTDSNPLCGDVVGIHIKLDGTVIRKIVFTGSGCVISQAAASMLCERTEGKTLEYAMKMTSEDVLEMLGTKLTPVRLKCALLSLHVMQKCIYEFQNRNR